MNDELDKMTERDILESLAEKVMGWKVCKDDACKGCESDAYYSRTERPYLSRRGERWDPLTDISAAFEVVDAMRAKGYAHDLHTPDNAENPYRSTFYRWNADGARWQEKRYDDKNRCRAIAVSALRAVAGNGGGR